MLSLGILIQGWWPVGKCRNTSSCFHHASPPSTPSRGPTGGSLGSVSSGVSSLGSICTWEADSSLNGDNVSDETWVGQWDASNHLLSWGRSNSTDQRSLSFDNVVHQFHSLFSRTVLVLEEPEGDQTHMVSALRELRMWRRP